VFVAGSFWNRKVSTSLYRKDRTHVEDLKDLVEVQLPGGDRLLVVLRAEVPRDRIPFIPLDQLLLNVCHGPKIESILVDGSRCMFLARLTTSIDLSHHTRTD